MSAARLGGLLCFAAGCILIVLAMVRRENGGPLRSGVMLLVLGMIFLLVPRRRSGGS